MFVFGGCPLVFLCGLCLSGVGVVFTASLMQQSNCRVVKKIMHSCTAVKWRGGEGKVRKTRLYGGRLARGSYRLTGGGPWWRMTTWRIEILWVCSRLDHRNRGGCGHSVSAVSEMCRLLWTWSVCSERNVQTDVDMECLQCTKCAERHGVSAVRISAERHVGRECLQCEKCAETGRGVMSSENDWSEWQCWRDQNFLLIWMFIFP